ncbi:hypothetical protein [Tropicimonas isoalkanivorans]|uniref:Collagenase NC10 and Endostatin n=1 Tax=Tropicimonas isoalkanivorans TaxID=441112 RepID=A0A1I1QHX2_9RHOB|nr:hypothetical protein [Tropicimonas isoalkanivorans]SFD18843.1 hypothetical protein SAMN04488094_11925 [Tropicimonas isoalkanivorans]
MLRMLHRTAFFAAGSLVTIVGVASSSAQSANDANQMSFFVSSRGSGDGANFGGLEGADAHCTALAEAAGSTRTWAAYLSTSMFIDRSGETPTIVNGVSARDRIGTGPWHNAKGVMIAKDVEDLHSENNNINLETALDETGNPINGRGGDEPLEHDILTGSDFNGHYSTAGQLTSEGADTTCKNWTSNGEGSAIVGHHDRAGLNESKSMVSWNSSHGTAGCGEADLPKTGGVGLIYCFATD